MSARAEAATLAPRLGLVADALLVLGGTGLIAGSAQISFSLRCGYS